MSTCDLCAESGCDGLRHIFDAMQDRPQPARSKQPKKKYASTEEKVKMIFYVVFALTLGGVLPAWVLLPWAFAMLPFVAAALLLFIVY